MRSNGQESLSRYQALYVLIMGKILHRYSHDCGLDEHSRVKLALIDESDSDYINASFVPVSLRVLMKFNEC